MEQAILLDNNNNNNNLTLAVEMPLNFQHRNSRAVAHSHFINVNFSFSQRRNALERKIKSFWLKVPSKCISLAVDWEDMVREKKNRAFAWKMDLSMEIAQMETN